MKKRLFKWSVYTLFILLCVWLVTTNQIAKTTEQQVKTFLSQQNKDSTGLLRLQLIDYQRRLLDADVSMVVHSDDPDIERILGGSVLQSYIKHGPFILNDSERWIDFAQFQASTQFDVERLNKNAAFIVSSVFGHQKPLVAKTTIDLYSMLHYDISVSPINYELLGTSVSLTEGIMQGRSPSLSQHHQVTYHIGDLVIKNDKTALTIEGHQLQFLLNTIWHGQYERSDNNTRLTINNALARLYRPVLKLTSQSLQGYISSYPDPVEQHIKEIQPQDKGTLEMLFTVLKHYEKLKNLDEQVNWTLEESATTQEGQEHLYGLFRQLEQKAILVTTLISERLLPLQVNKKEEFPLTSQTLF